MKERTEKEKLWEAGSKAKPCKKDKEEEIKLTCCNIEITGEIEDYGLCPKCKEHL